MRPPTRGPGSKRSTAILALVVLTLAACSSTSETTDEATTPATGSACRDIAPRVSAHPDPASAARAVSTLTTYAGLAWNPTAPPAKPSTLTGGLFINFRPSWDGTNDAASNTNIQTIGDSDADSGSAPRHDPLTDLIILRDIDALLSTGVQDPALDRLR